VSERLRIRGGRVFDPANDVSGDVQDVCIQDGRVVASLPPDAPVLDASGLVVMPGGVDLHSHVAGPAVELSRRLVPRQRDAWAGLAPTTTQIGRLYARLGYTTVFDAAVSLRGARHAHLELRDTPIVDKGFYVVVGNDDPLLEALDAGEDERARHVLAWALQASRAYALKVVDPGGVRAWLANRQTIGLDEAVPGRHVTPRRILTAVAAAAESLRLPHPMHLHCNGLGLAGNATTTLATIRALEGRRAHLAHVQFHCYGGEPGGRPTSRAREVAEALNRERSLSADVGQVLFGPAIALTADLRAAEMVHELTGGRWAESDVEAEGGCGAVPFEYRRGSVVHAMQFAAGLELLLLAQDPWRLVLSTDHPNGGTFLKYPELIRLLMDRSHRDAVLARLPKAALEGTALADGLARVYDLREIAIVTRAAPARLLGLAGKGHLGPGADADVAIYAPSEDVAEMFAAPRFVLKGGVRVVDDGRLRADVAGRVHHVSPDYDRGVESGLREILRGSGALSLLEDPIDDEEIR
jgi:formylmethanofuran dehydrogenase subunit A